MYILTLSPIIQKMNYLYYLLTIFGLKLLPIHICIFPFLWFRHTFQLPWRPSFTTTYQFRKPIVRSKNYCMDVTIKMLSFFLVFFKKLFPSSMYIKIWRELETRKCEYKSNKIFIKYMIINSFKGSVSYYYSF